MFLMSYMRMDPLFDFVGCLTVREELLLRAFLCIHGDLVGDSQYHLRMSIMANADLLLSHSAALTNVQLPVYMLSEKYVSRSSEDQELMKGESAEVHSPLAYIKYIQG